MLDGILLLALIQLKHFVIDFPCQTPFQYKNKGTYLHLGGILHSGLHVVGTFLVLWIFLGFAAISFIPHLIGGILLAEFLLHYHIDWAKMNINRIFGWCPTTHESFWWLLGFDQLLHQLTYIGMYVALINWEYFL